MTAKPKYSSSEVKAFIATMRAAKAAERIDDATIYTDALLRVTVIVELGGVLWLVPKSPNGWKRRQRLRLTPQAELERLRPANISAAWLGVPTGTS